MEELVTINQKYMLDLKKSLDLSCKILILGGGGNKTASIQPQKKKKRLKILFLRAVITWDYTSNNYMTITVSKLFIISLDAFLLAKDGTKTAAKLTY